MRQLPLPLFVCPPRRTAPFPLRLALARDFVRDGLRRGLWQDGRQTALARRIRHMVAGDSLACGVWRLDYVTVVPRADRDRRVPTEVWHYALYRGTLLVGTLPLPDTSHAARTRAASLVAAACCAFGWCDGRVRVTTSRREITVRRPPRLVTMPRGAAVKEA